MARDGAPQESKRLFLKMGCHMRERFESIVSAILAIAAVAIAVAIGHREFFVPTSRSAVPIKPKYVSEWRSIAAAGRTVGDTAAPIKILEFADLECPFCRTYNTTLRAIQKSYPGKVAVVFMHFPLDQHRFARPAARAAECANDQGHFGPMLDLLYAKQDSLGLKPWSSYAADAGVPDASRFSQCAARADRLAVVDTDLAIGTRLDIHGTPTIIINGWKYGVYPRDSILGEIVSDLLAGKKPRAID
jgi:thiol-disulfide isomerase/thioredoxin